MSRAIIMHDIMLSAIRTVEHELKVKDTGSRFIV